VPDEWRTYRLVKLTHRLPSELDEEPAHALDWLLAIDETVASLGVPNA
jgi:hypothetical protein